MCKKLFYSMSLVLLLVISVQTQAEVIFSDDFDHAMMDDWSRINYQGWYEQDVLGWPSPGGPWVIGNWDGYQSLPDDTGVSPTMIALNYIDAAGIGMGEANEPAAWTPGYEGEVLNGVLRIVSTNSGWSDTWNSGPFLYKMVEGDFVAEVEVVAADYWWNNLGGLMARAANESGEGANENWVYLTYFPVYGVGNHMRDTINGVSTEGGITWDSPKSHLQLKREGNTFYFSVSDDGETWTSLPGLEEGLVRDDLPAELQVGIFHANYTGDWVGSMDFDNFGIETLPEPEPEPAPSENHPPIARAGDDQIIEQDSHAGGSTILDGSSSSDPDGDPLSYTWTWDGGFATGDLLTVVLPLGTTTITLVVNDGTTDSDPDTVDITVQDTTVPVIHSITATPSVLTPVNCEMVSVTVNVDASDICDPSPVCYITGVDVTDIWCPEPQCKDQGIKAKELIESYMKCVSGPDWELTDDPLVVLLRAKSRSSYGRVYTIHVVCEDRSGNIATGTVDVTVPGCDSK